MWHKFPTTNKRERNQTSLERLLCPLPPRSIFSSEWELRQIEILEQSSDMHNQTDQVSVEGFKLREGVQKTFFFDFFPKQRTPPTPTV